MTAYLATYLSIIALSLSALAWVVAAVVSPIIKESYWDSLPAYLVRRQKFAAYANMAAAVLAAAGVALQAYASAQTL
ncbi:hypothetical protein [Pseudaminobacter soli (ex Li et al. 2025)]|nr:hypothetical protein [Mesorhizobium soli]